MAIQTFVWLQILAISVLCVQHQKNQESSIFPPYLRFPGLPRPLNFQQGAFSRAHGAHIQEEIKSQERRSEPPQPEKRNQYQRPRTILKEVGEEKGGWLSQLGDENGGGEENTSNRNVEENELEINGGRQCMDKV